MTTRRAFLFLNFGNRILGRKVTEFFVTSTATVVGDNMPRLSSPLS